MNGGLVRGRMHPPTNSASPWNNYVLTTVWKSTDTTPLKTIQCVSAKSVEVLLRGELGLIATQEINLRCARVDVWVPPAFSTGDKNSIVFAPCDWTNKEKCDAVSILNWYEAWGTNVQPAHTHYVWPRSIATQVIKNDADVVLFQFDIKVVATQYILKVHLQWRPANPDPRPTEGVLVSIRHREPPPPGTDFVLVQDQAFGSRMCM